MKNKSFKVLLIKKIFFYMFSIEKKLSRCRGKAK